MQPVWADLQYWVSVGSYQQSERADRALADASNKMSERFSVVGTQTTKGFYYRVAAGPFLSREAAQDRVLVARDRGFAGAWLWADDADVFESNIYGTPTLGTDSEYNFDAPTGGGELQTTPVDSEAEEALLKQRSEAPELIEEAPESYKLNKLRRDAQLRSPPAQPPPDSIAQAPPDVLLAPLDRNTPISLPKYQESSLSIAIDGHLDESVWHEFPGVDGFRVVDPDTLADPAYRTVVKMFFTERGLYAGFQLDQPPETLVRWLSGRDARRLNRDTVGLTLDTSGEGRYGYWINLALGGNQVDGTVLPEKQFSQDWDGAWYGATQVTANGWNAEILIPWSQMAMPQEKGRRTLNAYASRRVASLRERWAVPALPLTEPLFLSALQPLSLDAVNPRQQWSIFPFASVTRDEVEGFTENRLGADLFWRPSTNFQVTAAVKPDFGNVESDDVIVNLGAFEVFFPERRLFFQEGTEVFDATPRASSRDNPTTLVNTRRIGGRPRAPDVSDDVDVPDRELNQPIELIGATKVVGQVGKIRYGLLAAIEDEAKFDVDGINVYQDGSDYGVARVLFEDSSPEGAYRSVGLLSTQVSHPDADATVHGLDYHYLTPGGDWKIDGQVITSDVDDVGTGYGGFVDVRYSVRRGLGLRWGLSHYDDEFDINDLGFARRNDATNTTFNIDYNNSTARWARKWSANAFAEFEVNGDGDKTRSGIGSRFGISLLNQDEIRMNVAYFPARDEDRASRDNGTFEIDGRHALRVDYFTNNAKRLSYQFGIGHAGEELGGSNYSGRLGLTWRPIDAINVAAFAEYMRRDGWLVWQEDRNFTTFESTSWRPRLSVDYFVTAKQQLRLAAQWVGIKAREDEFFVVPEQVGALQQVDQPNPETDDFLISRLNVQLRYRWEIAPLSELFVVYTLNGDQRIAQGSFSDQFEDSFAEPIGEQLVVKLRYRLGT